MARDFAMDDVSSLSSPQGPRLRSFSSGEISLPSFDLSRVSDKDRMRTFFDVESRISAVAPSTTYSFAGFSFDSVSTSTTRRPAPTFLFSSSTSAATRSSDGRRSSLVGTNSSPARMYPWRQGLAAYDGMHEPLDLLDPELTSDSQSERDAAMGREYEESDASSILSEDHAYEQYLYAAHLGVSSSLSGKPVRRSKSLDDLVGLRDQDGGSTGQDEMPSIINITREEFQTLPPTIQRKYFSTFERLHYIQDRRLSSHEHEASNTTPYHIDAPAHSDVSPQDPGATSRPLLLRGPLWRAMPSSDTSPMAPSARLKSRAYTVTELPVLPDADEQSQEATSNGLPRNTTMIRESTSQSQLRMRRQQSMNALPLKRPTTSGALPSPSHGSSMLFPMPERRPAQAEHGKTTADSMYDSFRWLDDDDDLDLRLHLDDYHINLRQDMPQPGHRKKPSFRRHMSISKMPFGRSSVSFSNFNSRPGTKDTIVSPLADNSIPPLPTPPAAHGHVRRASRALSIMSANKRRLPDSSIAFDPAAAHYQDPEARSKLRTFLGTPQKFDEALQFGFPFQDGADEKADEMSIDHIGPLDEMDKLGTFLDDDDDKSSIVSDDATTTEPESPQTPATLDKPMPLRPVRLSSEPVVSTRGDYVQAPASTREMTLRMTLTRPDLRAHDENMYGWRKKPVRKSVMREGAASPIIFTTELNDPKQSIERQFAMFDQEDLAQDNGVMKRFWKRVRRS